MSRWNSAYEQGTHRSELVVKQIDIEKRRKWEMKSCQTSAESLELFFLSLYKLLCVAFVAINLGLWELTNALKRPAVTSKLDQVSDVTIVLRSFIITCWAVFSAARLSSSMKEMFHFYVISRGWILHSFPFQMFKNVYLIVLSSLSPRWCFHSKKVSICRDGVFTRVRKWKQHIFSSSFPFCDSGKISPKRKQIEKKHLQFLTIMFAFLLRLFVKKEKNSTNNISSSSGALLLLPIE